MTTTAPAVDYAHTRGAERNRIVKAQKIARWAFDRNLSPEALTATVHQGDAAQLRTWAHDAGVTVPGSTATWQAAVDALRELEEWADRNPDAPRAVRQGAPDKPEPVPDAPEDLAPVLALHKTAAAAAAPKGWDLIAALGPLTRSDARCSRCRGGAITAVPVAGERAEWRCPDCPPAEGEWGHRLDWTPRDDLATHPEHDHRCYNPRCRRYRLA